MVETIIFLAGLVVGVFLGILIIALVSVNDDIEKKGRGK